MFELPSIFFAHITKICKVSNCKTCDKQHIRLINTLLHMTHSNGIEDVISKKM